ncbi:hypothetical protein L6303_01635, partial [archaeon]|nr:hypothetical protein [archaeon]
LLIFSVFVLILLSAFVQDANAYCTQRCATKTSDSSCYATDDKGALDTAIKTWTCTLNEKTVTGIAYSGYTIKSFCYDFTTYCNERECPSKGLTSLNGQSCTVRVPCNVWCLPFSLTCCDTRAVTGVWDASEGKCVTCTPYTSTSIHYSEFFIVGDNSNPYVYMKDVSFGVTTYTLQNPDENCLPGTPTEWEIGNAKFESACGAQPECDEKKQGDACKIGGTDGTCDKEGVCIKKECTCDDKATECGTCSKVKVGNFCKDVNGVGVLVPSLQCPLCMKYDYTGKATGTGSHPKSMEVCYDTVVGGKFTKFYAETCKSSGSINETVCVDTDSNGQTDKCVPEPIVCSGSDQCFRKSYPVNLVSGGAQTLDFGYCDDSYPPKTELNALPGPCGLNPVCGLVCAGECVPGEPPKKYDNSCNKVDACGQCGCQPPEYKCTSITCNGGTGLCSYVSPPGLCGPVPDCLLSPPDATFDKTYSQTTLYLISGNNAGTFSGYNRTSTLWQSYSAIANAGGVTTNSAPAVFFNGGDIFMITGRGNGAFFGYNWTGASWANYNAITNGLVDIGDDSKPSLFYMNGSWNMIAGNMAGVFRGFTFDGTSWLVNNTLIFGLPVISSNAAPTVFSKESDRFLISGSDTGTFSGYNWTGSGWQADNAILSGLAASGTFSSPYAYYNGSTLYLIVGYDGSFSGYNWTGSAWQTDAGILNGLVSSARASPAVFQIDAVKTKTVTYQTRFVLERIGEYPAPGSDCYQNKTQITVPEGHACRMEIYANTTHGWGVRLKTTTEPGKTLVQDPFNVCGYINESIYGFCTPTGLGGTPKCVANQTPVLQAGTYEFGIVSSSGVLGTDVSKGCAYLTQCSDCENPYANYYCDLCTKNICNDGLLNCGETQTDCGGPCVSGKETDNNYYPLFVFSQPIGIQNMVIFSDSGGINCVDGIDNDQDCLIDCADPDCVTSAICLMDEDPPTTTISFNPSPNKKGWFITPVNITLTCTDNIGGSGCAVTSYRINNSAWNNTITSLPIQFSLNSEGTYTIEYYSTDKVGNSESVNSAIVRILLTQPFSIRGDTDLIIPLGKTAQAIFNVKNLLDMDDTINITIFSLPNDLHHWTWLTGHRYDNNRFKTSLQIHPTEERPVPIEVFGGKVLSGGKMNITVESENIGILKSILVNVDIVYSEDGMTVETPEFGWYGFLMIAILGAILI